MSNTASTYVKLLSGFAFHYPCYGESRRCDAPNGPYVRQIEGVALSDKTIVLKQRVLQPAFLDGDNQMGRLESYQSLQNASAFRQIANDAITRWTCETSCEFELDQSLACEHLTKQVDAITQSGLQVLNGMVLPQKAHLHDEWRQSVQKALKLRHLQLCIIDDYPDKRRYARITPVTRDTVLVTLEPVRMCSEALLRAYAQSHHLTPAELNVLSSLSHGAEPKRIALEQGKCVSTIRFHIKSILSKVQEPGIRSVLIRLGKLAQNR
jgi:DNA-binding CsgD family transcriptional regulator